MRNLHKYLIVAYIASHDICNVGQLETKCSFNGLNWFLGVYGDLGKGHVYAGLTSWFPMVGLSVCNLSCDVS